MRVGAKRTRRAYTSGDFGEFLDKAAVRDPASRR